MNGRICPTKALPPPVRRVVTGHDAKNVAKVLIDGRATNHKGTEARSTLMWITDQNPAGIGIGENAEDMGARIVGTPPPPNGTRFCVIDFPPGNHPHMHRTETIDYAIVLQGEIVAVLDDHETVMKAGDIMIQRGTNHAWANRGTKRARVAFVLVDAEIGPTTLDEQMVEWLASCGVPFHVVANKVDKVGKSRHGHQHARIAGALGRHLEDVSWVSAAKGTGIVELRKLVAQLLD